MKRTRGYVEAVDYLTIRIEDTNCAEFLKKGGLSDRIRGGYSHHCLPINSRGSDIDELKFIGRCLNSDKHIVVSIFEIHHKREHKKGYGKTQIEFGHSGEDTEFYMRLRSENKPIEFKVKHFNLKNGHVYQVRRPSCIKAQNHCTRSRGKSNNGLMVIDCERQDVLNGKLDKHDTVYVEITKRDKKPDTCVDERNGYCCRYVNAEVKGGICRLYDRNRNRYGGNSFNKDNDRHGAFGFDHPNDKEKNVDIDSKGIEENGTEFNGEEASEVKTSPDASLKKEESVESKKEEPIVGQDIKKDNAAPLDNSEEEIEFEMEDEDVLKKDEPVAPTPDTANQKKETAPIPVSPSNNASSPIQEVAAKKEGNVVEEEDDDKKRSHIMMKRDVIPDEEENENELENDFELWQSTGSSKGGKKHNQDNELDDNDLFEEKSSKQTSNNKNKNEEEEEEEEREVEAKKSKSSSAKPKAKSPLKSNPKEESEEEGESEEERNLLEKEDREEREKEKSKLKASNQKNNKNGNKKTEEEEEEEEKEVEAKKFKTSAKPKSKSPSAAAKPTKEEEEEEEKEEEEKRSKTSAQPKSSTGLKFSKPVTVVLSDEEREAQEEKELLEKEEREEEEKENAIKHSQGMDEFTLDELAEDDPFSSEEDADKEKKNVSVKSGNKVVFMKGSKVEEKVSASPVKVVSSNSNVKPVQTQKLQETQQPPKMKMLPIEFQINKPSKTEETKPVDVKVTKPAETKQTKPVDIKLSEPVEIVIAQPASSQIEPVAKPSKIAEKEEEELSSEEKEGAEEVEDLFAEKDESEEEPTLKHSSKESSKESSSSQKDSSKHNDEEDEEEVRQKEIEEKERKEEMEEREREEKEDAMILEKEKEEELQEKMSQEREERADREKAHQDVEDAEQVHDLLKSGKTMDQIKKEMNEDVVESKDTQKKSDSFVLNISKSVTPYDKNTLPQTNNKAIPAILADKSISIASTNLDMIQDGNEKVIDEAEAELDDEFAKKR